MRLYTLPETTNQIIFKLYMIFKPVVLLMYLKGQHLRNKEKHVRNDVNRLNISVEISLQTFLSRHSLAAKQQQLH